MNTNQNKSSFGDWLVLLFFLTLIAAYFAYENLDAINAWLLTMQAAANQPHAVAESADGSLLAWVTANWGLAALLIASFIASAKMLLTRQPAADEPVTACKRYSFVRVKIIR